MRKAVRESWLEFNRPLEGRCAFMYLDTRGLVTCGVGNLIDAPSAAISLPWKRSDGSLATAEEIAAEWRAVKRLAVPESTIKEWRKNRGGAPLPLQLQGGGNFEHITSLRLAEGDIDALVFRRLFEMAGDLRRQFPSFDSWPSDAQMALLSLSWARGPHGFAVGFPKLTRALLAQEFEVAADECSLANGYEDRDAKNKACFEAAARVVREGLDPDQLHYRCE